MSFTRTVTLPVGPDEAFALLTEPERLRRWQTVSAVVDLRAGGGYRWTVTPGHVAVGTFREVQPGRRIVFGWGWEGSDDVPPDASTITVTVEPVGDGGSAVTLTHEGLSDLETGRHAEGWTHYLERLERVAATGDAGQDEWAWAPENLTPITASEAVLAAVQPVLRGLRPEDEAKPTPCPEFDCAALVEHLVGGLVHLGAMAGGSVEAPAGGTAEDRVSVVTGQVIDLWHGVDIDGSVTLPGGVEMPASHAVAILPVEILVHGWDLAQGSGQPLRVSDEVVQYVHGLAEQVVPVARGTRFADEVPYADDAPPMERLAAYAGRSPVVA